MKIYAYVEKGMGKTECQDRVLVGDTILAGGFLVADSPSDNNLLLAVADGVGGYPGGEKASLLAVDGMRSLNRRSALVAEDVRQLVGNVNAQIGRTAQANPGLEKMATTLTALVMNSEKAVLVHIGNCRLGVYKKWLKSLTKDQTTVADMVSRGEITEEEAQVSPIRNQIEACLGGGNESFFSRLSVEEIEDLPAQDNNLIFTCDGIHDYVSIDEMEELLDGGGSAEETLRSIARLARENGSTDDISIILADRMGQYS